MEYRLRLFLEIQECPGDGCLILHLHSEHLGTAYQEERRHLLRCTLEKRLKRVSTEDCKTVRSNQLACCSLESSESLVNISGLLSL
jgi:hypothetical protein